MKRSPLLRYGAAMLAVALALLLKLLLEMVAVQETPFLLIFAAIMVSAWYGGLGPGLAATVFTALIIDYFFLPPFYALSGLSLEAIPLGVFVLEGTLISVLVTWLHSARYQAEMSTAGAQSRQQDLRRSEERFRLLVEGVKDYAIFMLDSEGHVTTWNDGAERNEGYEAEEILGEHFSVFYTEEDIERGHPEEELRVAMTEGSYEEEGWRVRKDGSRFQASVLITALRGEEGNLRGFSKVVRDITERRRTEATLRESEARKTAIMDAALDCIITMDNKGIITDFNPAAEQTFGYGHAEVLGRELAEVIIPPSLRDSHRRGLAHYFATGEAPVFNRRTELIAMRADGAEFPVELTVVPIRLSGQTAFTGYLRDITERKRAEERLRSSLDSLLALYEAGQILGSTLDRKEIGARLLEIMQRVSNLSAAVVNLRDDQERLHLWHAIGPEDLWRWAHREPNAQAARRAVVETGEHQLFELRRPGPEATHLVGLCLPLRARDQTIGVVEAYGAEALAEKETVETIASLAGQAASALENSRLYEELAARERQLHDLVSRMLVAQEEERRRVAYDVHDGLTQTAIAAYQHLQVFAEDHPPSSAQGQEELDEAVGLIQRTVREARDIIADLRPTVLDDFGLTAAIELEVEKLRNADYEVSYEETLGDERLPVTVETALFRIAQEALTNVRKHARAARVRVTLQRLGQGIRLEVRDWGPGFQPTGATSRDGPGERVGLSSMKERVALLSGDFEVNSSPGVGTSIVAEVPLPETEEGSGHEE